MTPAQTSRPFTDRRTSAGAGVALALTALLGSACAGDRAEVVSHNIPTQMEPRQRLQAEVVVRNTGESAWANCVIQLAAAGRGATDAARLMRGSNPLVVHAGDPTTVALAEGTTIQPGAEGRFSFVIEAPDEETTLKPTWQLVRQLTAGAQSFADVLSLSVKVAAAQYQANPFTFRVQQRIPTGSEGGGIFVHDLDNDGRMDFLVTSQDEIGAYDHFGRLLWLVRPGTHYGHKWRSNAGGQAPGAMAGEFFGDGRQCVGYVIDGGWLRILDGATGQERKRWPVGAAQVALVANLRGLGDQDAILQLDERTIEGLRLDTGKLLWATRDFRGVDKRAGRQADLDGDGRDEMCGSNIVGPDGKVAQSWSIFTERPGFAWDQADGVTMADVVPGGKVEVVLADQAGREVLVFNQDRLVFGSVNHDHRCCEVTQGEECEEDPQVVSPGDFAANPGLEVFVSSACGRAPWVLDATGQRIAEWFVKDTQPTGWSKYGIESVAAIDWYGDTYQDLVALERWRDDGNSAIINAMTGQFRRVLPAKTTRLLAVDVSGDFREEAVVLDQDGYVKVFWNEEPPRIKRTGYWSLQRYRRLKQNWNIYNP